jgi:molybdate transport system ATP-binding protein
MEFSVDRDMALRITPSGEQTIPPLIALEHANVQLDGRPVLFDISWRLERGRHWAIVGANGSGKSTLLRLIRGDVWPDRDGGVRRYALDGTPQPVAAAAPLIGYVSPELHERYARLDLDLSARTLVATGLSDSIYLPREPTPEQSRTIDALLARFDLDALAQRPINGLSFGEMRLLLIVRALVRAPRVLVLDECANGLDRGARRTLLRFLTTAAVQTQVVYASHRADELPLTTTDYARIEGGRIVARGSGLPPRAPTPQQPPAPRASTKPAFGPTLVAIAGADVYRGETRVLREVAFAIQRGEHSVIRGDNGSGKSTFAALVAGTMLAAHGARVERFGSAGPFDLWELKRRIVLVSDALQTAYDAGPSVERVVASGFVSSIGVMHEPDPHERGIVAGLLRRLRIEHLAGRRFLGLSFGERRKVLIARGLVYRPDLLILDEIWSGLDAGFRAHFAELLHELADGGMTLLIISHHDDDVPPFARRVYEIASGRLTARGNVRRSG